MAEPIITTQSQEGGPRPVATNLSSEFNISQTSYPEDLMGPSSAYGNNAAIFYIKVQADSRLLLDGSSTPVMNQDAINSVQSAGSNLDGKQVSDTQQTVGVVGGGSAAAYAIGKAFTNKGLVSAGIGGAFAYTVVRKSGEATRSTSVINQAIALHMPTNLAANYAMEWNAEGTGAIGAGADLLDRWNKSSSVMAGVGDVVSGAASATSRLVLGASPGISRLTAQAPNPKKEQIFQGVDFRNFTFDYQFWPRTQSEAAQIREIIRLFKLHMHPEFMVGDEFTFLYPSEFDIRYYTRVGGSWVENLNIHRHTSCVLTNMSLSYSPQGVYTNLPDGMPTQINMQLQFKELALLTKENIQDGY